MYIAPLSFTWMLFPICEQADFHTFSVSETLLFFVKGSWVLKSSTYTRRRRRAIDHPLHFALVCCYINILPIKVSRLFNINDQRGENAFYSVRNTFLSGINTNTHQNDGTPMRGLIRQAWKIKLRSVRAEVATIVKCVLQKRIRYCGSFFLNFTFC